jgi:phage N-6-adenine-methyltransferase
LNTGVMFSSATSEWETPQWLFDELDKEFNFGLDVCATTENAKCTYYISPQDNALSKDWTGDGTCWMNPPYGREIGKWIEKARKESLKGVTVVCLLPARTDTRWFHDYIWDAGKHQPRKGVEVRFLKGRLKFGGARNSAPFPSMVVIFRPE